MSLVGTRRQPYLLKLLRRQWLILQSYPLPDMSKSFIVKTDALGSGIGAVLMQEGHPITYINKVLGPR